MYQVGQLKQSVKSLGNMCKSLIRSGINRLMLIVWIYLKNQLVKGKIWVRSGSGSGN